MREIISRKRRAQIVKAMRGRRVAVVGDWMLDRYVWGAANRISPEAAVPIVDFVKQSECLGGAGNVAANLATLGARVESFGVVGNDETAEAVRRCLREHKLSARDLLLVAGRPTTLKTRIIARHQQVVRVDREVRAPLGRAIEERLTRRVLAALPLMDALVISDYDKGVITDGLADRVLTACQRSGVPAFVKPKWSRLPTYRGATAVICNRLEAGFLVTRSLDSDELVEEAGRALLAHFGCSAVVITRGEKGMSVFEQDFPRGFHISATSRERPIGQTGRDLARESGRQVFDVTGAGDTVLATLALASAAGARIPEAAVMGNVAAGVVVGKLGTAQLTRDELAAALSELDA